ncbi:MAG: DNA-directed RNA polymerase subunit alpha [Candidatus Auribacterota bacterium]|jgi:DNA-directed RNA polymerase subunit alpha|uniref:DNA-directed RNA polymerase subunit alpha n=1 Tax=Candidatus Auribacter fodinae TaxID=2093366 RepID=A0A3A4QX92_9BACT|nr:MAG: DNA-directed RNA polymerase subunit alpha [Candidatus Auribacter fodinae]
MTFKIGKFEIPKNIIKDETVSAGNYGVYIAEPFETGFGFTVGNSLRRILLSSLEGGAITSVKIDGVHHELATISGVVEDVAEIILNLKKVLIKVTARDTRTVRLDKKGPGPVTAGDILVDHTMEIINPDHQIATLAEDGELHMELEIQIGRGYTPADQNKDMSKPIGTIPIDSIFTPVIKVKYEVEDTRVGQMTDYDKLILHIWTDGRITPDDALSQAAAILREHLLVFEQTSGKQFEIERDDEREEKSETEELERLLLMSINEIELSVRSANCIASANINTIGELVQKSESEMLKYRNFGKKSLNEIKAIIENMGLKLGMSIPEELNKKIEERKRKVLAEPQVAPTEM